ncbi:MAG: precorrin-2 C(20)-methyltransferase [Deltaproteobacteria bacterium]|jgi:precorrin-2/cobalt-factor-2 C20-methyltransferase|nr:precorrin-2 C(20)-methyltransferase [Deltaproteobacteria bacterium]
MSSPSNSAASSETGVLYGLGVGPGDPDLITLKALKILKQVDQIFTAASTKAEASLAGRIVSAHLPSQAELRILAFPMSNDSSELDRAWQANAEEVAQVLRSGQSAAFLTIGDCLTYSTFSYLLTRLFIIMPEAKVESVPGIASYQLAASKLNRPLVLGRETLSVVGGANDDNLEKLLEASDNLVILKAYQSTSSIIDRLKALGLAKAASLCVNLALPGEKIVERLDDDFEEPMSYFSLILVNKRLLNKN